MPGAGAGRGRALGLIGVGFGTVGRLRREEVAPMEILDRYELRAEFVQLGLKEENQISKDWSEREFESSR